MTRHPVRDLPDFDERMDAARTRAQYELGDPSWAGVILGAFMYPDEDGQHLVSEMESGD